MKKNSGEDILFDVCLKVVNVVHKYLLNLTDEQRLYIFDKIKHGYCSYCGSSELPCYCQNDE